MVMPAAPKAQYNSSLAAANAGKAMERKHLPRCLRGRGTGDPEAIRCLSMSSRASRAIGLRVLLIVALRKDIRDIEEGYTKAAILLVCVGLESSGECFGLVAVPTYKGGDFC